MLSFLLNKLIVTWKKYSNRLDDTKKSDEILEQMKQRIQENDQHIEQLTKRLSEKVTSLL